MNKIVPPPPTPEVNEEIARQSALASTPGTCKDDVPNIKILPMKGELGRDKYFDKISVHRFAYRKCLIEMVMDTTKIEDPGQGPKRYPYALGDLAYDLLADTEAISYGQCIPADIMKQVEISGSRVVYDWLSTFSNREQLHSCLTKSGI